MTPETSCAASGARPLRRSWRMPRWMRWCGLAVAAASAAAACTTQASPPSREVSLEPVEPLPDAQVREAPVLELDEFQVGFFAYGEGGDDITGAVAAARVAIIADPEAWWKALRDDAPDFWEGLPPGYQVPSMAERVASAPAQWITTGADGTAVGEREPGKHYIYCAVAPGVDDLVAGCSEPKYHREDPRQYSIYFSDGRALFMSAADDAKDGSSHYSNLMLRRSATLDPVKVAYLDRVMLDWSDDEYPEGWYPNNLGVLAVIEDANIGQWWRAISGNDELALSVVWSEGLERPIYTATRWSGSHQDTDPGLRSHERPSYLRVSRATFEAAPAQYLRNADSIAEITLDAGDYLLCAVKLSTTARSRLFTSHVSSCVYEDIIGPHETVIDDISGEIFYGIREQPRTEGARLLTILRPRE